VKLLDACGIDVSNLFCTIVLCNFFFKESGMNIFESLGTGFGEKASGRDADSYPLWTQGWALARKW
jgi:hypothetical protein